jgi:hypothetical protein
MYKVTYESNLSLLLNREKNENYNFPVYQKKRDKIEKKEKNVENEKNDFLIKTDLICSSKGNMDPNTLAKSPFSIFLNNLEKRFEHYFDGQLFENDA